jgi:hypothetical protein
MHDLFINYSNIQIYINIQYDNILSVAQSKNILLSNHKFEHLQI